MSKTVIYLSSSQIIDAVRLHVGSQEHLPPEMKTQDKLELKIQLKTESLRNAQPRDLFEVRLQS